VQKGRQAHKMNREDSMDHSRWRKLIKNGYVQDRCVWVNVSLGTGSPM